MLKLPHSQLWPYKIACLHNKKLARSQVEKGAAAFRFGATAEHDRSMPPQVDCHRSLSMISGI
jgi:hypothetical protein